MYHRGLHSMTATASSRLVLFAGAPKSGPMLGDLWVFNPASSAWEELDPDGQVRHLPRRLATALLSGLWAYKPAPSAWAT